MITVAQRPGRLGNLVLQYINLIAFAEDHHATIANPSFFDYNHYFVGTHRDFLSRYPSRDSYNLPLLFRILIYKALRLTDQAGLLAKVPGSTFIDLPTDGEYYLNSPEFLSIFHRSRHVFLRRTWHSIYPNKKQQHIEKARAFFKLVPHRARRVQTFLDQIKSQFDILIGVHIRQTDFKQHCAGRYYFTSQEYATFMKKMALLFPNKRVSFVICSDAPQSSCDFLDLNVFFPKPEQVEDLFILAGCDYIIGPAVSSYCSLASFLGKVPRIKIDNPDIVPKLMDFSVWNFD